MYQIKWLRRLVRRHTNPIPQQRAIDWKKRISICYAILAWNAFGMVTYMIYTGRKDWAQAAGYTSKEEANIPPAAKWAKILGIEEARVIKVSGVTVTDKYDIRKEEETSDE